MVLILRHRCSTKHKHNTCVVCFQRLHQQTNSVHTVCHQFKGKRQPGSRTLVKVTMNFPETVSDRLCRNYLIVLTKYCISCLGGCWRSQMWRSGLAWLQLRSGWSWGWLDALPNSLKRHWRRLIVIKWIFSLWAKALVDIDAASVQTSRYLNTCGINLHVRVAPACAAVAFNQHLDVLHLPGGWINAHKHSNKFVL